MRPYKVLLFIVGVFCGLAVLCAVSPGTFSVAGLELRWPTMKSVLGSEEKQSLEDYLADLDYSLEEENSTQELATDTIDSISSAQPAPVAIPLVQVDSTTDTRIFLQRFYASLAHTDERTVRVMHYGDSQIEEDRMTQQIREELQKRYGGSGVGLMPLLQTIPANTVRQELQMNGHIIKASQAQQGPMRYMVHGPQKMRRKDGLYGMMGQVAIMADSLKAGSEDIIAICKPQVPSAHYSTWRVFADSTVHYTYSGDTMHLTGHGAVYGLSQQTDTGVIVDNIPMRGCLGTVFTKMDSTQLATFYREQNVQLIIMQFGGNAIPSNEKPETIRGFVKGYREQVQYLRRCAPGVSILFIGPSDMMRLNEGEWQTYPMVAYMDRLLQKMAREENIAYFSLYDWMGGAGSMLRWQEDGLASADGVHFYRSGARKAGNAVAAWILEGMTIDQSSITDDQLPRTNHQ